ncbi:MAG: nitroreductase family protein [Actinomycetota bacterium]
MVRLANADLNEALRTTGAVRQFQPDPVTDETIARLLDTARFAPNGGNRQAWRVVVVRDPEKKRALRDLYVDGWYRYVAMRQAGLTPWAPVTDRAAEAEASLRAPDVAKAAAARPGFPELLDQAPALLVLLADLRRLAATDRDLDRYGLVGGASIYPFAWSLLLAARAEGLGGVLTTVAVRREDDVRALLDVPEEFAVAGVLALGRPLSRRSRLKRLPVSSFATVDSFKGPPLTQT